LCDQENRQLIGKWQGEQQERELERNMEDGTRDGTREGGQCHQQGKEPTRHIETQEPLLLIHCNVSLVHEKCTPVRDYTLLPLSIEVHARPVLFV